MKTKITKTIQHGLIVEESDLRTIFNFLKERYNNIEIIVDCDGGNQLETSNIEEIIKFDNPSYRKIKKIKIYAINTNANEENLSLIIDSGVFSIFDNTVVLIINSKNNEEARGRAQELLKRFSEMKPWYSLTTRISIFSLIIVCWGVVSLFFEFGYLLSYISRPEGSLSAIASFNILLLGVLGLFLATYPIDCFRKWMFPAVFFNVGCQRRVLEKIKKTRHIVFVVLILGLILSVIANIISKKILP